MIKFKNSAVLLITLLFLFVGCQPEEEPDPVFEPVAGATTLAEEPGLQRLLTDFLGTSHQGRTESAEAPFGTLDYSEITEFLGSEDQPAENYTIRLMPPEGVQSTREYLHLIADRGGYRGYIAQYIADPGLDSIYFNQATFTGVLNILNLSRELQAVNEFKNGKDLGDTGETKDENGRIQTDYINCNCRYELRDDQTDSYAWGETAGAYFDTGWKGLGGPLVFDIYCVCDEAPSFYDPDGGGTGGSSNSSDGLFPIGDIIPNSGYGSGSGSGSGDGGHSGDDSGPILQEPDGVTLLVPPACQTGFTDEFGNCLSEEDLVELLEGRIREIYQGDYFQEDCMQAAENRFRELLHSDFRVTSIAGGLLAYVKCLTSEEKAEALGDNSQFAYGFVNAFVDELDFTALVDLFELMAQMQENRLDCLNENVVEGENLPTNLDEVFAAFMKCTFGLEMSAAELRLAHEKISEFAGEVITDPYERGQFTFFALTAFSPTKVTKVATTIRKLDLMTKFKRFRSMFNSLMENKKNFSKLDEMLAANKYKDGQYVKQTNEVSAYIDNLIYQTNQIKGNIAEMITDIFFVDNGYQPLHVRIANAFHPSTKGIDHIYKKDGVYYIVETKYNTAELGMTSDGLQMSDDWINGSDRLYNILDEDIARDIELSDYKRILSHVQADGSIKLYELDEFGQVIGPFIP